ncbi:multiple sugar transport system ATP-binding protein [Neobacillus niacini]|uniref:ABC transporter ATP-binding protein n=1 Tax=Neobacillus niacini TaxID=86668 RepID=UPI002860C9BB|nr:sn-glycerol-3-phosphate ABC transporter ATP-binding protein UgpC [Neobacillus niacini]MDR7079865.1 multiple sugar transport system ATP-binding protein [Neobacillus niacini]
MARIELKHLFKNYIEGVHAVTDFDLTIEDEEFIVLVGPSGCGKSTTLRMIAGLEDISSGEIYIDGKKQNTLHPKDRDIAMVFQNYALYPHMNVFDNMAFGLKMRKTPKDEIDQRVKNAARILDIEKLLDRKPKELSGGQRQRVALGRAIVREAKVFLMDEPLSNLDAKLRFQTRAEITKLHRNLKATTIYVTHDQTEAMSMATRIVVMKDGYIQQIGTPKEIYLNPANVFVGKFIGSPAMNFIDVSIKEHHLTIGDKKYPLPQTIKEKLAKKGYANKNMLMGIRPEDLQVVEGENKELSITAEVEFSELMGAETLVYFKLNGETVISKINSMEHFDAGQKIQLGINFDKIHFFDKETELRVPTMGEGQMNESEEKESLTA